MAACGGLESQLTILSFSSGRVWQSAPVPISAYLKADYALAKPPFYIIPMANKRPAFAKFCGIWGIPVKLYIPLKQQDRETHHAANL